MSNGGEDDKKLLDVRVFMKPQNRQNPDNRPMKQLKTVYQIVLSVLSVTIPIEARYIGDKRYGCLIHVRAWSNDGGTDIGNCEMLCKAHNQG